MNKYVDLGLPSGTLWAAMNVGAERIVDDGVYFNHREALNRDVTLPTKEQFEELIENTTHKWFRNYNNSGVNGMLFIGKNGNEVFFPASGYSLNGSGYSLGNSGYYWSSYLNPLKYYINFLTFYSRNVSLQRCSSIQHLAFPLRGVKNK